jgi:TonB family protein
MRGSPNRKSLRIALSILLVFAGLSHGSNTSNAGLSLEDDRNIEKLASKRVQPNYPPLAQKYKIEGVVTVQVTVEKDGKVSKAEFVRGHNIFRSVSLDAAKRWEFKVRESESLEGTIQFTFKLTS